MIFLSKNTGYIVVCPPKTGYIVTFLTVNWRYGSIAMDNWLYSCLYPLTTGYIVVFPQSIIKFLLQSVCTSVPSQIYYWNTVACDVKQQIHTYTPFTESSLKTGYMVTIPPDNWLYGSILIENWLYSCLFPPPPRITGYIVVFPQDNY